MIIPFKNRAIDLTRPVLIYRNLHAKRDEEKYSILQDKVVCGHTNSLLLQKCEFKINKKTQLKVRETCRKKVHAFIKGNISNYDYIINFKRLYYNPYEHDYFMSEGNKRLRAKFVKLTNDGVLVS